MMFINIKECNCCFDNVHEYIECNHGHSTCKKCIFSGVKNAIGINKKLKCTDESDCSGKYSDHDLFYCINKNEKLMEAYKNIGNVTFKFDYKEKDPSIVYCCVPIILHDGCNKLKCHICNKLWCWICKEKIDSYKHFNIHGNDRYKCPLYNEDNRINPNDEKRIIQLEKYRQHFNFIINHYRQEQYIHEQYHHLENFIQQQLLQHREIILQNNQKNNRIS